MTLKGRILRCSRRVFIILVSLMMTWFSEKMLIFTRCIHGFMSNLIKKSWTDSTPYLWAMAGLPCVPTISICKWASPVAIEVAIRNNKSWFKKTWFKFKKSKSDPFSIYSVTNLQIEKWMSYKYSKVIVYICIFCKYLPFTLMVILIEVLWECHKIFAKSPL